MSAAIGGRSVGIGAAPDRSASQQTEENKKKDLNKLSKADQKQFENLSQAELDVLTGNDPESLNVPFGARLSNLFTRRNFRTGLSNKFLAAPSGANVDRRNAQSRVKTLDSTIAEATAAKNQSNQDRNALERSGVKIFAGSPLDIAFSNKTRSFNNIIAQADAERKGIALQTDTAERKRIFDDFTVITDKKGGKGLRRGIFNTAGRGAVTKEQAEFIRKQQFKTADADTAIENKEIVKAAAAQDAAFRASHDRQSRAVKRRFSSTSQSIEQKGVDAQGKVTDFGEKEFFTDQLLAPNRNKINRVDSPEFRQENIVEVTQLEKEIATLENNLKQGYSATTGRQIRTFRRGNFTIKGNEEEHFFRSTGFALSGKKKQLNQLTTLAENPLDKQENLRARGNSNRFGNTINTQQRKASLFEAVRTLGRIQGLPQFNGDRGSDTQGKAVLGALNKVQNQRIQEQTKSKARGQVKRDFDTELAEIQNSGSIPQKEKRGRIFAAARKRDEALKRPKATNIQFEQSREGFAASRTNIVSGATAKSVQELIDEGRNRRRKGKNQNA